MSAYASGWLFLVFCAITVATTVYVLAELDSYYPVFLVLIVLGPASLWLFTCPICGRSIFMRGLLLCVPWPSRECTKCHADLTQERFKLPRLFGRSSRQRTMLTLPISATDLTTILELIGPNKLSWSILEIWAMSYRDSGLNILELEKKTEREFGYLLEWEELLEMSKQFEQVIDCTIVGCNTSEPLPHRATPSEVLEKACEIVVVAFDGSCGEISIKDEVLRSKLAKNVSS